VTGAPGHAPSYEDGSLGGGHTIGIAIEIPQPFGAQLDAIRERFAPEDGDMPAHVTVLAPIDVDADVFPAVLAHLEAVAERTTPFHLALRGADTFRPVSPVVFVTVAEGISACEQLERQVRTGDLAVETRFPYHPHVTVAHDVPDADLDRALAELADYSATMEIHTMGLHENVDGCWRLVRAFPFGG
jgi:2'-5' RNA ligase